ncbi:uncharacterized protein LOC128326513 isoform X2 [Hemicordylus capensis]|uniref:uncharacterized protein LOC128326513 isoform X2 n=1 Tax=Hemicordylus capensis TaxID=884348 RepID=UPI002302E5CB|nr:uncharacterized protein LOC128326513 isoform X2 [Hemicordylus capensis]
MKNRSSTSSTANACHGPGMCYDQLIKQCVDCKNLQRVNEKEKSINTTCFASSLCYDRLIKQCVDCGKLNRGGKLLIKGMLKDDQLHEIDCKREQANVATTILRVTSTTIQVPATLAAYQVCSALLFGVCALVGLIVAIVMLLWFVKQQRKRRQTRRKTDKEDSEENESCPIPFEHQVHKEISLPEEDPMLCRCPYSNGTAKTARADILKENVHHVEGSDVTEDPSLSSYDKKCNHTFPLPATELGATVLVTTKTTQEYFINEELP